MININKKYEYTRKQIKGVESLNLETIVKNISAVMMILTAVITLSANFYRMLRATSIEKKLETYNQTFIRHILTCILWWFIVMIGFLTKFSLEKWTKADVSIGALLALCIFILIVVLYGEIQTLTISTRKKIFFVYKKEQYEFINRIDPKTLLLKNVDKEKGEDYKLLSYDNFSFEDGIKIKEKFSETRNNSSFIFYNKLVSNKVTGAKLKFNTWFFLMITGFSLSFSVMYSKLFWTLIIFSSGLLIGGISFKKVVDYYNNVANVELQVKKKMDVEKVLILNKKRKLVLYSLGCLFLFAGIFINYASYIFVGIPLIMIGSVVLTFFFVKVSIIDNGKNFIKNHNIHLESYY
jgi:hypothetical protein